MYTNGRNVIVADLQMNPIASYTILFCQSSCYTSVADVADKSGKFKVPPELGLEPEKSE